MFRSNKINMVIAIVVAVMLWMYVVGQVNPTTTKKFADVPITFVGEEALNNNGLAVADIEVTGVSVTLEGKRAVLMQVEPKEIGVTVDISDLGKGKNSVPIVVTVPADTKLAKSSVETINITVEDRIVETKDVRVAFEGNFEEGSEPGQISTSPQYVEVSGARSMIDKVDHIQVTVGAGEEREGKIETDVTPIPVDAGGARVEHVELGQKRIHVSAVIMKKKTVDLKVETTGTPPDGFQLDTVEVAKQITIKGPKNVLENINEISADSIDISRLTETTTVPLHIVPPAGIEISAESQDLQAVVNIKSTGISNLSFQSGDLKVNNLGVGL